MTTLETLERKIDNLTKAVRDSKPVPKRTWVSAGMIMELTGWNKERMRTARENGIIRFKEEDENGVRKIKYLLESIPELLIKK